MKKLLPLCALVALASLQVSAQNGARYRFDNFDTREGVRVELPPAPAPFARKPSKRLKLTARTSAVVPAAVAPAAIVPAAVAPVAEAAPAPRLSAAVAKSLDGFSTGDAKVDSLIVESGRRNGVDPVLLYAIMHRESAFKRRALSHKGASGLMQLMPPTARRFGVTNIWDPAQNIEGGARYMRVLLDMFRGDVRLALAGYNAGEGAVLKYGRNVPPYSETREYVRRITERYAMMRDPATARRAPVVTRTQIARLKAAEQVAPVYETNVYAVRTPDGRLRLVSQ